MLTDIKDNTSLCIPYFGQVGILANTGSYYFLLNNIFKIAPPIFLSIPDRVVGMPVFCVKARFIFVIPNARFHEKLTPGIFVLPIFFIFL